MRLRVRSSLGVQADDDYAISSRRVALTNRFLKYLREHLVILVINLIENASRRLRIRELVSSMRHTRMCAVLDLQIYYIFLRMCPAIKYRVLLISKHTHNLTCHAV